MMKKAKYALNTALASMPLFEDEYASKTSAGYTTRHYGQQGCIVFGIAGPVFLNLGR